MALNILAGRAGTGKSTYCIDSIARHLKHECGPVYLVVPEQYSLQAEARLLEHPDCKGLLGNEVVSFKRMAFRILSRYGGLAKTKLNPSGRIMLLGHVVKENIERLEYFGFLEKRPGEINRLLGLIDEFGRYEVTPDMLEEATEDLEDELLKNKLSDLSLIYSEYRNLLLKDNIDDQDVYSAFLEKLVEHRPFENAVIWLDGFAGFTSYEFDILKELVRQCRDVNVCLCMDEEDEYIFDRVYRTCEQLKMVAKEANADINTTYLKESYRFTNKHIAHLERNFGKYPAKRVLDVPENIKVVECRSIYEEVDRCAREIVILLREEGLRYKDIAVTARSIELYEKVIKIVFPKYNIPYFIDSKKNIEDHPLIRFILTLLDIVGSSWERTSVLDFLKTGLYTEEICAVDRFENFMLEQGFRGKKDFVESIEEYEEVEALRKKFYEDVSEFEEEFKKCRSLKECCKILVSFFLRLDVQGKMQKMSLKFKEANMPVLANEYARIWNITMEVIEQIYVFMGGIRLTGSLKDRVRLFKETLLLGFSEYKIGFIPFTDDSVQIGVADRTRSHNIKGMILLGANEGVFPATFVDEGLLKDDDREYLRSRGITLAEDNRTKANMEYYLIYTVLSSPSEHLIISYSLEDQGLNPMRPSVIVQRIKNIFPSLEVVKDYNEEAMERLTLPLPFLTENAGLLRNAEDETIKCIRKWYRERDEFKDVFERILKADTSFRKDLYLPKDIMDELFARNLYMSASKIEKYNKCPYSYFMRYGIKAEKRKEALVENTDVGTFMHTLIDKASKKAVDLPVENSDKLMDDVFFESLEEVGIRSFYDTERKKFIANRLLRYAKKAFRKALWQIHGGVFQPAGFEVAFGPDGELPPVRVRLDDGRYVQITGRIDRYDVCETEDAIYLRVIDYKSSDLNVSPQDLINGQSIQLVAYMDALVEGIGSKSEKAVVPVACLYFTLGPDVRSVPNRSEVSREEEMRLKGYVINDPEVLECVVADEEDAKTMSLRRKDEGWSVTLKGGAVPRNGFDLLRKQLHKTVKNTYERMAQGDISITPVDNPNRNSKVCDYCEYITVCGIDTSKPENFKKQPQYDVDEAYTQMGSED